MTSVFRGQVGLLCHALDKEELLRVESEDLGVYVRTQNCY